MAGRDLARLGCALLVGMALAFPAGLMVAGSHDDETPRRTRAETAARREVFSPKILDDPYFLEQQRRNVEALEAGCHQTGEMCAEAQAARRWLNERD